ncbi:MAG: hypothetical protein GXP49_06675, partial [Deltaproteobacteria bacterium]|nr:hypothetical protein [Deltaproteobacteria bacterium]
GYLNIYHSENSATVTGFQDFIAGAAFFDDDATYPFVYYCGHPSDHNGISNDDYCPTHLQNYELLLERKTRKTYTSNRNEALTDCFRENDASYPDYQERLNVARFFWDLYDSTQLEEKVGFGDDQNHSVSFIVGLWDRLCEAYPSNVCKLSSTKTTDRYNDRGIDEPHNSSGAWNDANGRNVFDYKEMANCTSGFSGLYCYQFTQYNFSVVYANNCLDGQETN